MSTLDTHAGSLVPRSAGTATPAALWRTPTLWAWRTGSALERALAVAVCVMLTAACAQITIPVPGSPVPVTLQTFPVILAGLVLGSRLGALSMAAYALVGAVGFPVFADASGGLRVVAGATGGYLLGFIVAAWLCGRMVERAKVAAHTPWASTLLAAVAGNALVFACGLVWLRATVGGDWPATLTQGLWPYLPGTLVKLPMSLAAAVGLGVISRVR